MTLQALRGTADLLGEEAARWAALERAIRRVAGLYRYEELRTPIIEPAGLFLRSVGETTDIVQKEMFRFADRGGDEIALRPEGTAPVVRAYLQHNLHKTQGVARLWYLGPMFRGERPQAGRFRQFHQCGAELIGTGGPWADVEIIALCCDCLRAGHLTDFRVWVSSMGCRADQTRSAKALRQRLEPARERLCQECQGRLAKNVFRVLDCKKPPCQGLVKAAGGFSFELCPECRAHFDGVREGLKAAGIAFDDTATFARGLDYYTRTVFEIRAKGLGAQDAVAAGGRYDELVEEFGGPRMGAVGFAAGLERLLMAAREADMTETKPAGRLGVYLAVAQPELLPQGIGLARELRARGVATAMDCDSRSLKAQLREADKLGCRLVVILGEAEVRQRALTVKDLEQGSQETVPMDALAEQLAQRLKRSCHA